MTDAGRVLEEARKAAGITQAEVAAWLGISRSTYQRRIAGRSEFKASEARVLGRRLGRALRDILLSDPRGRLKECASPTPVTSRV